MLFQRKVDRALDRLHEESASFQEKARAESGEEELPLEKYDFLALVISAFLVFVPVALLVLGGIALLAYFFLLH